MSGSGPPPNYVDLDDDPLASRTTRSIQTRIVAIRALENVVSDRDMVGTTFNLYNAQVRMSIDNRLDLAERYLYSKYRGDIEQLNE
jgi:hypothetical protein